MSRRRIRWTVSMACLTLAVLVSGPRAATAAAPDLVAHFQALEQGLFDRLAFGDKRPWESVLALDCVVTSEEGLVMTREELLASLRPLPEGLAGGITVRELTVQELGDVAVVRFLADEWETLFGQRITVKYRITDTFRRAGAEWKLAASHTSVVTQDPPDQEVSTAGWQDLVGRYQLPPDGWIFTVELRDGELWGGRDPQRLRRLVPLTPDAFVLSDSLGEWLFVRGASGKAERIVNLRKFAVLVWNRI